MTDKNITLYVWDKNSEKISVVQGEVDSRFLNIKLMDHTTPLDLNNKTVTFLAKKPDNTVIFNNAQVIDANKGLIKIILTSQICAIPGILSKCEIHVIDNNSNTLIVKGIDIEVIESLGESVEESISEYTAYEELIGSVNSHESNYSNPHNVTYSQVNALSDTTKYGATLETNGSNLSLKDQNGDILSSIKIQNTAYTAGENISISDSNVISATGAARSVATSSTDGLMSASDKTKLDSLSNYSLPTATATSLGGIKIGNNLSIEDGVLSANGAVYTAGENISISDSNVISASATTYSAATSSADGLMSASDKTKIDSIENGAKNNIQSDWNQTDTTFDDYIKNKPTNISSFSNDANYISDILTSSFKNYWYLNSSSVSQKPASMCYGDSLYVVVGKNGSIFTSNDTLSWSSQTSNVTSLLRSVIYSGTKYVAVGDNGVILTSSDATVWTKQTINTSYNLFSVCYANSGFIVVGEGGTILTSNDAINWTISTAGTSILRSVCYNNNTFVIVGHGGSIFTSENAITWTKRTSSTSKNLMGVCYGNGKFIACGESGTTVCSSDGINWSVNQSGVSASLISITYGRDFKAAGSNGIILTSIDGINWFLEESPVSSGIISYITYIDYKYYALYDSSTNNIFVKRLRLSDILHYLLLKS